MPPAVVVLCTALTAFAFPTWIPTTGLPDVAVPTRTVPGASTITEALRNWYDIELSSTRPINNGFLQHTDPHIEFNAYDPNLWTLPIEYSSSMAVFLVLLAGARLRNRVRIALSVALVAYLEYNFDFVGLLVFLAGMVVCDLHFEIEHTLARSRAPAGGGGLVLAETLAPAPRRGVVLRTMDRFKRAYVVGLGRLVGLVAFVFALWLLSTPDVGTHESWGYVTLSSWVADFYGDHILVPFGAILMVFVLDHTPFLQILFTNRFSQYMGKISYSLYLVHGPLVWSIGIKLGQFTVGSITGGDTNTKYFWGMMLAFAFWCPMAIYSADLVTRHVDDNFVWLAKWVYDSLCKKDE